jgi:predicted nucleic acid-binding protein
MPTAADAVVLDASAFVRAQTETTPGAAAARRRIAAVTVHAPHLIVAEVGSVARRLTGRGSMSAERGLALVRGADEAVDRHYAHGSLARLAWLLRAHVTFHDGLCVALATTLGLPCSPPTAASPARPACPAPSSSSSRPGPPRRRAQPSLGTRVIEIELMQYRRSVGVS